MAMGGHRAAGRPARIPSELVARMGLGCHSGLRTRSEERAERLRAASSLPWSPPCTMGQGDAADIVVVLMSCCVSGPAERPLDTVATIPYYSLYCTVDAA